MTHARRSVYPHSPNLMPTIIRTDELDEFSHAVSGLTIDFVRMDAGFGPAHMVSSDGGAAQISVGGLDFSAVMHSQPPAGSIAVQVVSRNPGGMSMCGVPMLTKRPSVFVPGRPVDGWLPAGVRATTLVTASDTLHTIADALGTREIDLRRPRLAIDPTPAVRQFVRRLEAFRPEAGEDPATTTGLLEALVRALAPAGASDFLRARRRSEDIVEEARSYADGGDSWIPTTLELCRATMASESTLRAAFVDVLGAPPSRYFQARALAELRRRLVLAEPREVTVAEVCTSLGLNHFGRVAGRYRAVYGETPSQTLQRRRPPSTRH